MLLRHAGKPAIESADYFLKQEPDPAHPGVGKLTIARFHTLGAWVGVRLLWD